MQREPNVAQLVKWNVKKARTYVRAISVDLDRERRARVGKIFGLISVAALPKAGDALAANIEDALERGIDEALRRMPAKTQQEELFEAAIARLNRSLALLLDEHGLPIDPEQVNATIISQLVGNVAIASWGRPSLLLLRAQSQGVAVFDLGAQSDDQPSFDNTVRRRGFSSLVTGKIGPRDRMLAATIDVRAHLTDEVLAALMAADDPEQVTIAMRTALAGFDEDLSVGLLTIDSPDALKSARLSLTHPQLARFAPAEPLHAAIDPTTAQKPPTTVGKKSAKDAVAAALRAASVLARGVIAAGTTLSSAEKRRETLAAAKTNLTSLPDRVIGRFNGLSLVKKLAAVLLLTVALSFNISLAALRVKRGQEEKIAAYEEQLSAVTQKIDAAETSVLYKDEDRAKSLLGEANGLLASLPVKTEDEHAKKAVLVKRIADTTITLKKGAALGDAVIAAALPDDAAGDIARLVFTDGQFWTLASDGTLYRIPVAGASEKIGTLDVGATPPAFLLFAGDGSLIAGAQNGTTIAVKGGKQKPLDLHWPAGEVAATAVASWGSSLYTLDASHNRIEKQSAAAGGYAAPQHYLKDATDVSTAVDFAIDGEVHVLLKSGRIVNIIKGVAASFSVSQPDPEISDATRLWTDEKSPRLYVLEPSKSRIVTFDKKNGNIIAQLQASALSAATGFVIDEKNHAVYAGSGKKILKFPLPAE